VSRFSYKSLILILLFLLIPIVLFLRISQKGNPAAAGWWDETWMYRQSINISSHNSDESNVFITTTIGLGSTDKAQSDAGDFRFLNSSGQLLPYYIVSGAGTTSITFHIALAAFDAGAQTLYAYYGNPSASNGFSASDFSTEATNYTLGSLGTEEVGGGPIAHWKFDEGVGTTAYDSTGNYNGVLLNGALWQSEDQCFSGKCIYYDGTNDYVSVPNNTQLKFIGSNFTVSVWAKPVSKTSHVFVAKGQGTRRRGYQILTNSTNVLFLYSDTYDSGDHLLTGPTYNANEWMYLSLVVNKNLNQIVGFVNGNSIGTMDISTITEDISQDYSLEIGRNNAYYAKSFIDDVKIFPYARTESQIKADYAAGLAGMSTSSDSSVNIGGASTGKSLSDGLVGYWKFDEGVGTTAIDYSGNNFTAILAGTQPTWSAGKYGVGLTFTDESYVNISASTTFDFSSSNFALSTWIKMTSSSSLKTLFYKGNPYCDSCQGGYVLNVSSGTPRMTLDFSSATGNMYTATSSTAINDDRWHHLLGQRNGNKIEIYIDGNLSVATTFPSGSTFTDITGSTISLSRNAYSFNGSVDEARIFNRALSPTEVKQLYEFAPGPILYYKLEEGFGTTVNDSSGNNNNAIFYDNPSWITGKFGKGLGFDGQNDFIEATQLINLDNNPFTFSTWYKNPGVTQANNTTIIGNYKTSTTPFANLHIPGTAEGNTGKAYFTLRTTGANPSLYSLNRIDDNKWHHISAIRDENYMSLYIDGVFQNRTSSTAVGDVDSGQFMIFGSGHLTRFTKSQMDEIKIYNYARTQQQILQDMEATTPVGASAKVGQPIAHYKFDEGFGSTTANWGIGGSGLKGNLTGSVLPIWTSNSKINQGLSFTGTNSAVGITGITQLNNTGFTTSGWIKINSEPSFYGNMLVSSGGGFVIYYTQNTRLPYAQIYNGSGWTSISCPSKYSLPLNQWAHLALVYRPETQSAAVYANGVKCSSDVTISGGINSNYSPSLYIGNYSNYQPNTTLDEVKIYNYALSADEIKQDYNQGSTFVFGTTSQTIGATTTNLEYCVPGSTDHCAPPVGEWKFDEGVGTTAYDTSGNNYSGLISGALWQTGKIGKAMVFDGSNDYIEPPIVLNDTSAFTINAWVKGVSGPSAEGGWGYIVHRGAATSIGNSIYWIGVNLSGNYAAAVNGNYSQGDTGILANKNIWRFISLSYDGSSQKIYIDGQLKTSYTLGSITNSTVSNRLGFGSTPISSTYRPFDGSIDQVRIYNYARTPAQIAYDYNKGEPVGWWKMDECQGTLINDWSGNANHGTLSIGASGTQTSPGTCPATAGDAAWFNGKLGKLNASLNFDLYDDLITIPDNPTLNPTTDLTMSSWVKKSSDIGTTQTRANILFKLQSGSGDIRNGYSLNILNSNNKIQTWYGINTGYNSGTSNYQVGDTNWHLITVTRNGVTEKIYIDGKLDKTTTYPDSGWNASTGQNLIISNNSWACNSFNGQIDDVRIYNYALTPTQIKTLYNNGSVNFR